MLLEAALLKKFILSTRCPTGPAEILHNGKGGLLYKIGDHEKLAKNILYSFENKKKLKKKINLSYKNLVRYDYRINLEKYVNILKPYLIF